VEPTRSGALVDLIDRILDKGVVLHADIIISVSDIPLIGISLKAAIAGMKTMLDYGMMDAWDETLRRQACEVEEGEVPLTEDERIILKTFGEVLSNFSATCSDVWQPGYLYLTNKRLFLFRRKPSTILFETTLDRVDGIAFRKADHVRGRREALSIILEDGTVRLIHANGLSELRDEIEKARKSVILFPIESVSHPHSVKLSNLEKRREAAGKVVDDADLMIEA